MWKQQTHLGEQHLFGLQQLQLSVFVSSCIFVDSEGIFDVQGGGFSWLFPFENGAPPIGWHDAVCYLVLPVALVVSQFITQKILQPPSQDESAQQTNAILKFLPLMIGETTCSLVHAMLWAMGRLEAV